MISALLHDPRSRPAWRGLLVLLLVVVSWLAFGPPPPLPDLDGGDKVNHTLAFLALATTATLCNAPGLRSALFAFAALLLYGGFIELVQTQLPHRQGDWNDLAADALGVILGLLLAAGLRRAWAADKPEAAGGGPLQ